MIYSRNWLSAVMRNNNYYDITEINKTGWYYCKSKDRIEFWEAPAKKKLRDLVAYIDLLCFVGLRDNEINRLMFDFGKYTDHIDFNK